MSSVGNKATQIFKSVVSKVELEGGLPYATNYKGQGTFPCHFSYVYQFVIEDKCSKTSTVFMFTLIWISTDLWHVTTIYASFDTLVIRLYQYLRCCVQHSVTVNVRAR